MQSRSSALRQRAFSLAGRSANSSWACSVNGGRNNYIPTHSADSEFTNLLLLFHAQNPHYPSEHRSACAEEVSCQGAARHLASSCTGTGSYLSQPDSAQAGCVVAKLGRAVAALRVGKSAQRSASLEPSNTAPAKSCFRSEPV